ncbi:RNA polymerase sigma factor [Planctomycetota bacterium]
MSIAVCGLSQVVNELFFALAGFFVYSFANFLRSIMVNYMDSGKIGKRPAGEVMHPVEVLLAEHYQAGFRLACHLARNIHDAEDILQNACIKAYRYRDSFKSAGSFYSWFSRILVREAVSHQSSKSKKSSVTMNAAIETMAGESHPEINSGEMETRILGEFEALPKMQRIVMTLYAVEEMNVRQIASHLDCPVNNVKTYLYRARRHLKNLFQDYFRKGEF